MRCCQQETARWDTTHVFDHLRTNVRHVLAQRGDEPRIVRQDVVPILGDLRKELHFRAGSGPVGTGDRKPTNLDQSLPRSLGVQESEIDSGLVDQGAVRSVRQPGEQCSNGLRWTLRGQLRARSGVCLG